jgi:hypothetical protein
VKRFAPFAIPGRLRRVDSGVAWVWIASGVSGVLALALYIALMAIAVFVVRPVRPSAATLLASAGALAAITMCASYAVAPIISRIGSGSVADVTTYTAINMIAGALLHLVWFSCLIAGIVQLARPAKLGPREGG